VGSYPTGIFVNILLKLYNNIDDIAHYIWLRTTLSSFLYTRESNRLRSAILKQEKMALQNADLIISNGIDTKNNYLRLYGIDSFVIPNALNLTRFDQVDELKFGKDRIRIAFIGRFFENKGIIDFCQAIDIFNDRYLDLSQHVEFVFVGWGNDEVLDFIDRCKNCHYWGEVRNEEMIDVLNRIHCGMALTKASKTSAGGSGVSNGLLELMASGRIIAAYDNEIFRQFDRQDSFVYIKEGDIEGLAMFFAELVSRPESFLHFAQLAQDHSSEFSIERHLDLLAQCLL